MSKREYAVPAWARWSVTLGFIPALLTGDRGLAAWVAATACILLIEAYGRNVAIWARRLLIEPPPSAIVKGWLVRSLGGVTKYICLLIALGGVFALKDGPTWFWGVWGAAAAFTAAYVMSPNTHPY